MHQEHVISYYESHEIQNMRGGEAHDAVKKVLRGKHQKNVPRQREPKTGRYENRVHPVRSRHRCQNQCKDQQGG